MVALEQARTDESGLHIWTDVSDTTVTVHVDGDLDIATAPLFSTLVAPHTCADDLLVDLSACGFIDSSGITALLRCRQQLDANATMRLTGAEASIVRTLQICGLLTVLGVDTE
jgi:anti-anti-sigma factor